MMNNMDTFGAFSGVGAMSTEELRKHREKLGQCLTCGRQCFAVKSTGIFRRKKPLTISGKVDNGRCLTCDKREGDRVINSSPVEQRHRIDDPSRARSLGDIETYRLQGRRVVYSESDIVVERMSTDDPIGDRRALSLHDNLDVILEPSDDYGYSSKSLDSKKSGESSVTKGSIESKKTAQSSSTAHSSASVDKPDHYGCLKDDRQSFDRPSTDRLSLHRKSAIIGSLAPNRKSVRRPRTSLFTVSRRDFGLLDGSDIVDTLDSVSELGTLLIDTFEHPKVQREICRKFRTMLLDDAYSEIAQDFIEENILIICLDIIEENIFSEETVYSVLKFLCVLTSKVPAARMQFVDVDNAGLEVVIGVCEKYCNDDKLMGLTWELMKYVVHSYQGVAKASKKDFIFFMIHILGNGKASFETKGLVVECLTEMSTQSSEARALFCKSSGIPVMTEFMFLTESVPQHQYQCCQFIYIFAKDEKLQYELVGDGVALQISNAMSLHPEYADVQHISCKALSEIANLTHNEIMNFGIAEHVLNILKNHTDLEDLVQDTCKLLARLTLLEPSYALMMTEICSFDLERILHRIKYKFPNQALVCDTLLKKIKSVVN